MWLTRLMPHLSRATRLAGCMMPRGLTTSHKSFFASYSTRQPQKLHTSPPAWCILETELDDLLVPRMMSITPLESLLSSRYSLPKPDASSIQEEPEDHLKIYDCPTSQDTDHTGEQSGHREIVQCKNILKIRRRKMNKHKYKKLQKRTKFLRKKVLQRRNVKKQKRFEKDLDRIWRKAGLRKAPEGFVMPNIFIKSS
ncbi:PREDICTED: aurora kinase A-interacting protein [Nanorana parkeri]|uniref:aurora kinase A-interacting protein n=1 Tax=Nanorana parkeri TaxID=125878 RepID=UPI0008542637|nr:PREDICTED: aurora kinase A-interacting protein [Nanorana parkeri]